ncbi:RNA-splicing factor [Rhodotorula toruloides]
MSYNGVGLSTPRGSGTSGHIQANRSHLRPRQQPREAAPDFKDSFAHRPPDQGILDHERKRRVEAQCFELQVSLEDDGVEADEIERQVSTLRDKLLAQSERQQQQGPIKQHERHQLAAAKEQADARMRAALGIKADHQEGAAFDRELQEQLKQQRIAEREQAREERAKIQKQLEADREKAQRERDAQRKRHEEDMARERRHQRDGLDRSRREHADRMKAATGDAGAGAGAGASRWRDFDAEGARDAGHPSSRLPYGNSTRSPSPPPRRLDSRSPRRPRYSLAAAPEGEEG